MSNALVFPGQGAQYVGMGKANAERYASARAVFEEADSVLGFPLSTLCFEGPAEELDRTVISQPAIYTASAAAMAAAREARGELPEASFYAGLSLGEYTALHAAGALSFADGLRLVHKRGEAMQAACDAAPSGMASVIGMERAALEAVVEEARGDGVLVLANVNSPQQIAISGSNEAVERAAEACRAAGAKKVVVLSVAGAFHSPLMAPARDQLAAAVEATALAAPSAPVVNNVDGQARTDPAELKQALLDQLTGAVEWVTCVQTMVAGGVETFHEFGPGKVLTGLLRRINRPSKGVSNDVIE